MDVTAVLRAGHMWNHYYRRPQLAAAIAPYVYFDGGNPSAAELPVSDGPTVSSTAPWHGGHSHDDLRQ